MKLFIVFILSIIFLAVYWIYFRFKRGYDVTKCMIVFVEYYEHLIAQSYSKKEALEESFKAFNNCPWLRDLTDQDIKKIVNIIGEVPNPPKVISKILIELSAEKAYHFLRDEYQLNEVLAIYRKKQ